MQTFRVKNFEQFQHYKDRSPPWIKLYNELLDDYAFGCLSDASRWHLVAIWLLASRSGNCIPLDPEWISRRINASDAIDLQPLFDAGFLIENQPLPEAERDASKPLALARSREERQSRGEREERREEPSGFANAQPEARRVHEKSSSQQSAENFQSDEDRYWGLAGMLEGKGVSRSRLGQLANLLNGDFAEGIDALHDVAESKEPSKYLGAIIRNRKAEQSAPGFGTAHLGEPAFVQEFRQHGYGVERLEGGKWRCAGAIYDEAGEQVGC